MLGWMVSGPLSFTSPAFLAAALALSAAAALAVFLRRPSLPRATLALAGAGLLLLCLAAGGMIWHRPAAREVTVMVDLSPSTRSAEYRSRAKLEARVWQLLGDAPYRVQYFSDSVRPAGDGETLADLPGERTVYAPPAAAAVVLFSDGRFDSPPPGGPVTYPVLDPGLVSPADAAVEALEPRGRDLAARVRNTGGPRSLALAGTRGPSPTAAPNGAVVVTRAIDPQAAAVSAALSPGDLWPENDALAAPAPPPPLAERWVVGAAAPSADWRSFAPGELPTDPAAYLAPSVIVLSDVAASDLSSLQQQRLRQYVRDLGGSLVILGGPRAFAAGGYAGSTLESLSPLASTPPEPTTHWMLLADSSGSMGGAASGSAGPALWQYAADAVLRVLPRLPPDDLASVGNFSEKVNWWSAGRSVRDTLPLSLPPPGVWPNGPTNLRPALEAIAAAAEPALPKQLLLLTDADAEMGDAASLIAALKAKNIRLHLLALGEGRGLPVLRRIVAETSGRLVEQAERAEVGGGRAGNHPGGRAEVRRGRAAGRAVHRRVVRPAGPRRDAVEPHVDQEGRRTAGGGDGRERAGPAGRAVERGGRDGPCRRLQREPGGGRADRRRGGEAAARPAVPRELGRGAAPARDGRRGDGRRLSERPEAGAGVVGRRREASGVAPRPTDRARAVRTVAARARADDRDGPPRRSRAGSAGRGRAYATEFDAIGADREALRLLAERTGGHVIDPTTTTPIDFRWPPRTGRSRPGSHRAGRYWWRWGWSGGDCGKCDRGAATSSGKANYRVPSAAGERVNRREHRGAMRGTRRVNFVQSRPAPS